MPGITGELMWDRSSRGDLAFVLIPWVKNNKIYYRIMFLFPQSNDLKHTSNIAYSNDWCCYVNSNSNYA